MHISLYQYTFYNEISSLITNLSHKILKCHEFCLQFIKYKKKNPHIKNTTINE